MKKQIQSLNAELVESQQECDALKKQIISIEAVSKQALQEKMVAQGRMLIIAGSIDGWQAASKDLQEKLKTSETRLGEAEHREKILIAQKQDLEQQQAKLRTDLSSQKKELENIKKQKEKLQKEKQALEKTKTKEAPLAAEQAETLAKLKEQETKLIAHEEELKKKTVENQSLKDRLSAADKDKKRLETQLREAEQANKSLKAKPTGIEKAKAEENQQLKAENFRLKKQGEESNKELESFKAGYVLEQKDWQEAQEKSEVTIKALKEREQKLLANLKDLEERPQEFKKPIEELIAAKGEISILEKQKEAAQQKLASSPINKEEREQVLEDGQSLLLEPKEQLQTLRAQLAAKAEEIERSERGHQTLQYALKVVMESNDKLIKQLTNQSTKLVRHANQSLAASLVATSQCLAPVIQDNQNLRYNEAYRCLEYQNLANIQDGLIVDNHNLVATNHRLYQEGQVLIGIGDQQYLYSNHRLYQEGQVLIGIGDQQYLYSSSLIPRETGQALMREF